MLKFLKCYLALIKFSLNLKMVYSINFWVVFITDLSYFVIQVLVFQAIFSNVSDINGWSSYQVMFFIGTFLIINALYMTTYFFGILGIPDKVRTGALDLYLIKPINTKLYVSFESFNLGSLFNVVPGIMILVYSLQHMNVKVTIFKVLGYICLLFVMYILNFFLMLMIRIPSFWFINIGFLNDLENELVNFAHRIPGIVFKGVSKLILYVLLPYGIIATIPTQFFTDIVEFKSLGLVIGVVVAYWLLSSFAWKKGIGHYNSASS